MAWVPQDNSTGWQPIEQVSTVQNHPLGTIIRASDPTYGSAEFIYLKGVSSGAAGSWVTYNMDDGSTTLLAGNAIGPVAIMMSALDAATDFGWCMVQGKHPSASSADVSNDGKVYIDSVAGKCDDAVVAGDKVHNAKWASADDTATGTAEVEIARPFVTDEST